VSGRSILKGFSSSKSLIFLWDPDIEVTEFKRLEFNFILGWVSPIRKEGLLAQVVYLDLIQRSQCTVLVKTHYCCSQLEFRNF
jgi:hypothetical protein